MNEQGKFRHQGASRVPANAKISHHSSAGFQPARHGPPRPRFTARRPWHAEAAGAPYFVSTRTHDGRPIFGDTTLARMAVNVLLASARKYDYSVLAYCFMPDHAHFVIVPHVDHTISGVMRIVKGCVARAVNAELNRSGAIWQPGFFDKVPDELEGLNAYIRYVENNPVVAGLSRRPSEYEFSSAGGRCLEAYYQYLDGTQPPATPKGDVSAGARIAARAESPRSDVAPLTEYVEQDLETRRTVRAKSPRSGVQQGAPA